jgi:hypothetical protein
MCGHSVSRQNHRNLIFQIVTLRERLAYVAHGVIYDIMSTSRLLVERVSIESSFIHWYVAECNACFTLYLHTPYSNTKSLLGMDVAVGCRYYSLHATSLLEP